MIRIQGERVEREKRKKIMKGGGPLRVELRQQDQEDQRVWDQEPKPFSLGLIPTSSPYPYGKGKGREG